MDLIRANMELMALRDVNTAMRIDMPSLSSKPGFTSDNEMGYYIIINTWLLLTKQYSKYGWVSLAHSIAKQGLISCIKEAQDAADHLIRNLRIDSGLFRAIWERDFLDGKKPTFGKSYDDVPSDRVAEMLRILRYPKRFSPVGNNLIQEASIKKFLEVENRTKLLQRRGYSPYIISFVKEAMNSLIDWDSLCSDIDHCIRGKDLTFTTGVGFDSDERLGNKLHAVSMSMPEYFIEPFGIPYSGARVTSTYEFWGKMETVRCVRVSAVPKSYKASRIIAMEDTTRQAVARSITDIIDRYLPEAIPLHDQGVNQTLAWEGSVRGNLATLDLSNASDCISKVLFWEIFPAEFTDRIYPYLGTHTLVDDKCRVMQQMSTAGNSLTFILESIVFCAICRAATNISRVFGLEIPNSITIGERNYAIPSVYGDDIVVFSEAAPCVIDVLEALGFIVNETKSYVDGPYRESCGEEYLDGTNVSSTYFPRFPIEGKIGERVVFSNHFHRDSYRDIVVDTMASLISLQHRLFDICYPAAALLAHLIRSAKPSITTSLPGSLTQDIWDYEDTWIDRPAPYAEPVYDTTKWGKRYFKREFKRFTEERAESRHFKLALKAQYDVGKISDFDLRLFDLYRYRQFLQYGPRYEDELLRLLGITEAPISKEQAFGKVSMKWAPAEDPDTI